MKILVSSWLKNSNFAIKSLSHLSLVSTSFTNYLIGLSNQSNKKTIFKLLNQNKMTLKFSNKDFCFHQQNYLTVVLKNVLTKSKIVSSFVGVAYCRR